MRSFVTKYLWLVQVEAAYFFLDLCGNKISWPESDIYYIY